MLERLYMTPFRHPVCIAISKGAAIPSVSVAALRRALDDSMQVMKVIEARLDQALNGVIPDHLRAAAIDLMLNGCNGRYDELRDLDKKPGCWRDDWGRDPNQRAPGKLAQNRR
jgi:hypothetical protein